MKPTLLCGVGLLLSSAGLLLGSPASQQPPYEDIVKNMLATVEQIGDILATITVNDKSSAETATPQLKTAADKLLKLRQQANDSKQPNLTEKDRLAKLYAPKFEIAFKRLREETLRVKSIDIPGVEEALQELASLNEKKEPKDKKKGDK
jgi:hypothetical protein